MSVVIVGTISATMQVLITKSQLAKELNRDVRCLRDVTPVCVLRMGKKLLPLFNLPTKK
jgi:hypothetical protein